MNWDLKWDIYFDSNFYLILDSSFWSNNDDWHDHNNFLVLLTVVISGLGTGFSLIYVFYTILGVNLKKNNPLWVKTVFKNSAPVVTLNSCALFDLDVFPRTLNVPNAPVSRRITSFAASQSHKSIHDLF